MGKGIFDNPEKGGVVTVQHHLVWRRRYTRERSELTVYERTQDPRTAGLVEKSASRVVVWNAQRPSEDGLTDRLWVLSS
jgi:hypothetical protein